MRLKFASHHRPWIGSGRIHDAEAIGGLHHRVGVRSYVSEISLHGLKLVTV
jgi:hypothetical protein